MVAQATNGTEAIQLIERHRADLVFLDLQMPEVDGLSVVRLLTPRFSAIMFVTAYDELRRQGVRGKRRRLPDEAGRRASPARSRHACAGSALSDDLAGAPPSRDPTGGRHL